MRRLSIDGPNIGDWYAVAFISWTDPNNDRIEQQGKRSVGRFYQFYFRFRFHFVVMLANLVNLPDSQKHKSVNDFQRTCVSSVH